MAKDEKNPKEVKNESLGRKTAPDTVKVPEANPADIKSLLERIALMEQRDKENQDKIKMLVEVADKGRVMNYENKLTGNKKIMKAHLSLFGEGIIVGWRTAKDELLKHPTTGTIIGETQEYELLVLGKDEQITKATLSSYSAFSNARYSQRIEVDLVSKKEDFEGNISWDVRLPDGRTISLDSRFIN